MKALGWDKQHSTKFSFSLPTEGKNKKSGFGLSFEPSDTAKLTQSFLRNKISLIVSFQRIPY